MTGQNFCVKKCTKSNATIPILVSFIDFIETSQAKPVGGDNRYTLYYDFSLH